MTIKSEQKFVIKLMQEKMDAEKNDVERLRKFFFFIGAARYIIELRACAVSQGVNMEDNSEKLSRIANDLVKQDNRDINKMINRIRRKNGED